MFVVKLNVLFKMKNNDVYCKIKCIIKNEK